MKGGGAQANPTYKIFSIFQNSSDHKTATQEDTTNMLDSEDKSEEINRTNPTLGPHYPILRMSRWQLNKTSEMAHQPTN